MTSQTLTKELLKRSGFDSYLGRTGLLPNPDTVLRRTGKGIDAYRELKNDPHVWSCVQSRKSGLLSLKWSISGSGPAAQALADMLEKIDMQQLIRDILEAPLFGFQPIEIIWCNENGHWLPQRLSAKPQEWFCYDKNGELMFRGDSAREPQSLPDYKILNVRYESSYLNPYGHALLSKCYWPVSFKNGGLRFWVNFTERYGMPILLGQYSRGATNEEAQQLADHLAEMTEDAVIVAPSDISLEMHEASKSSSVELYRELIKFCNSEISKAILSQTLTTELDMGSYAASQTHYKIRREVILADIQLVESAVATLIRYIMELNFQGAEAPEFRIELPEDGPDIGQNEE